MGKQKLLYVSPFWPIKSGISEYSENLVWGLQSYFDVTLLSNNGKYDNKKLAGTFCCEQYSPKTDYSSYDYIIYNMGNNPDYHGYMYDMIHKYPGYIILHDFVLYYLTVGYYAQRNQVFSKIYEMAGVEGIQIVKDSLKKNPDGELLHHKDIAALLPLNKEILQCARGVFVHSQHTANLVKSVLPEKEVYTIHLVQSAFDACYNKNFLRKMFSLTKDDYIVASIGFIAPSKQNDLVCRAVNLYNQKHEKKIHYVMVGEGDFADDYLNAYIHKTGFIDNAAFFDAIYGCDLIMNLRNPYNGESSATVLQCMAMKKPCVITDVGWFSELPDDAVVKKSKELTAEELCEEIEKQICGETLQMTENAYQYIQEKCSADAICKTIAESLTGQIDSQMIV